MTMWRKVAGTWKPLTMYRRVGGVWKLVTMWRRIGGLWKAITGSIVTVSNSAGAQWGYTSISTPFGSMNPNSCYINGVLQPVCQCLWNGTSVILGIQTASLPNSGFTTLQIGNTTYLRTAATYNAGSITQWIWTAANPFGTTNGVQIPVNVT